MRHFIDCNLIDSGEIAPEELFEGDAYCSCGSLLHSFGDSGERAVLPGACDSCARLERLELDRDAEEAYACSGPGEFPW